jgi:hypothetical protein
MSQHPSDNDLKKAVSAAVAKAEGEPIGLKTLQKNLETIFELPRGGLNGRKDQIKEYLMAAMEASSDESEEEVIPPRRGTLSRGSQASPAPAPSAGGEPGSRASVQGEGVTYEDGEASDKTAGKSRAGQQPDHAGFLKKRGDQGRIKLWRKRHFRLYRKEGVIAYFKSETDTEQLGEVSVTGAFLVDKRDDLGKFAFTITMKTTARVWVLQAPDEATMNQWIGLCTPLMKETASVRSVDGRKPLKPLPGLPLPFPPTYVQGFAEREGSASALQDGELDWTKLSHVPVAAAAIEPGQVAIALHGKSAQVEEIRLVKPDANGEAFIEDVPKQIKYNVETVGWASAELQLQQLRYVGDEKTQRDLLRKLVGRKITASVPGTGAGSDEDFAKRQETRAKPEGSLTAGPSHTLAFPVEASFTGKLSYDPKDDRYALVDEATNTVHFLNTRDARTIKLVDANVSKLNEGTTDAFSAPRLWVKFAPGVPQSVGHLTYRVENGFDTHINYVVTLSADEKKADVQGWYSVENKTSKTYQNATIVVVPDPKAPEPKVEEEKEETVEEVAAEEGKKKAEKKGFGGLMAIAGALFKGDKEAEPAPLKKHQYAVAHRVTLPSYDWAHAAFLSQQVPVTTEHLVRFELPAFTIKPQVSKEAGVGAAALVETVVRFANPLKEALPSGCAAVNRRNRSGLGSIKVANATVTRVEGGEQVTLSLEKTHGISATRVQTGYNFDGEKHFIIETVEIVVANSRNETVNVTIEESLFRWNNFEIPASKPVCSTSSNPRKISWNIRLNHGEDQTIKYTAFYSTFDLDSDYEPRN